MVQERQQIAEAFHPGDMLQEKLEELGMPIKEFALRCGKPEPTIHAVLQGKSSVTPDMAILFEKVLGIPAHLWLSLQCQFDEFKARQQLDEELQREIQWARKFPFRDMVEKGYLDAPSQCSLLEKIKVLLSFFGFAKTSVWEKYYLCQILKAEFRLSLSGLPEAPSLSAWLRYGENKAMEQFDIPTFRHENLKAQLPQMKALANAGKSDFLPELRQLCKEVGIILVFTPHLRNSRVRGATRWLKETPLVQVSDSYKRYDIFWFSFFHEIGHILLHGRREVFLEGLEYEQKNQQKEQEADDFASNCLIPRTVVSKLNSFVYSEKALHEFCQQKQLHKAFVVGHLHHLGVLKPSIGKQHIPSVDFTTCATSTEDSVSRGSER